MVKNLIGIIVIAVLIAVGAIYERTVINKNFSEFSTVIESLYDKVEQGIATKADGITAQHVWEEKKKTLHAFIPHTEIKEIDLWISETISLIAYGKTEDVLSKLDVLRELIKEVPKNFIVNFSNVF